MNYDDLIARIRLDANDIDADRWQNPHIADMIHEAVCEIFEMRPDKFQKTVIAKLQSGEFQQPCCCGKIKSVDALTDSDGVKVADIRPVDFQAASAFGRSRRCRTNLPTEYMIDSENKFFVNPPVMPNQTVYARINCAIKPENIDDLDCEMRGAVLDYVLYRLYGTETESATSMQKSMHHRTAFYEKLGLHNKIKREFQVDEKMKG